ncbi:metallopeptidase family protein [Schaalia sp. ZJ1691]|uniref:metallopeptidase family protein n=1 Tax=Schaalia sp. ZJ1691 TaxID=2709404 RepID=UPI001F14C9EF|nr:metallopeptidase family protein [Schaalia sp. ZJ1691]
MSVQMSRDEFEQLVDHALDQIPNELLDMLDNVAIFVEEEPLEGMRPDLLGLYDGVAVTERADYAGVLPDRIFIFMNPTLEICETPEEVAEEVAITVVHEIAHYFGIDDARLHAMGWG